MGDDAKSEVVRADGVLRAFNVRAICGAVKENCFSVSAKELYDSDGRLVIDGDNMPAGRGRESCTLIQKSCTTKEYILVNLPF